MRIMDALWMAATVVCALLLLMGLLAGVLSPKSMTLFAFAGLAYPIVYLLNVACAMWWAVRWRWWFFVPALMLLVGIGNIGRYYQLNILKNGPDVTYEKSDLVVVTYNVKTFSAVEELTSREEADSVAHWINSRKANVVCLQEAHFSSALSYECFKDSLAGFKYGFFENSEIGKENPEKGSGLVMLSSYPIVDHEIVWSDSVRVGAVWADLDIGRDTVRVFNLHLQSTGIAPDKKGGVMAVYLKGDTLTSIGGRPRQIIDRLSQSYRARAIEAEGVARSVEKSPYPVIVCGDFNDVPTSYTYKRLRSDGLQDTFVERGRGAGFTFKGFGELFRIDYVLSDDNFFDVKEYDSCDLPYSDHNPVVVRLGVDVK